MFKNQKNAFWEALIVALVIFLFGILLGVLIENYRTGVIRETYIESDLYLTDLNILLSVAEEADCNLALEGLENFADEIFWQSLMLENYDESSEITRTIEIEHKKYDLMRASLWNTAIKLKERCGDFHTIVYIYEYNSKNIEKKAIQQTFSKTLTEIKDNQGKKVILIPFAGNIGSSSINLLMKKYNITQLPTIIIDERIKLTEISQLENIESYLEEYLS